jgi:hypothetical protein
MFSLLGIVRLMNDINHAIAGLTIADVCAICSAVATIILAMLTYRYVRLTNEILKANDEAQKEELRPYVLVNFFCMDSKLYLEIANLGRRPAINFRAVFEPPIDKRLVDYRTGLGTLVRLLTQTFIAPSHRLKHVIRFNRDYFGSTDRDEINTIYQLVLHYEDVHHLPFRETYQVDLGDILIAKKSTDQSKLQRLHNIEQSLDNIGRAILTLKVDGAPLNPFDNQEEIFHAESVSPSVEEPNQSAT